MNYLTELIVYVPANQRLPIAAGSAVVGSIDETSGLLRVDYEGDVYGFRADLDGGEQFAQNLRQAADRHQARYPTVARLCFSPDEADEMLVAVGTYLTGERPMLTIDDPVAFDAWLAPLVTTTTEVMAAVAAQSRQDVMNALGRRIAAGDTKTLIDYTIMNGQP